MINEIISIHFSLKFYWWRG